MSDPNQPADDPFAPPPAGGSANIPGIPGDVPPPPPPPAYGGYPPAPGTPPPPPPYGAVPVPAYGQGYAEQKTNGMAIASLVLGIVGLVSCGCTFFVAPVLAIIFSVIGRKQIAERGDKGSGMAVAGLVLGILGVLLSLFILLTGFIDGFTSGFQDGLNSAGTS